MSRGLMLKHLVQERLTVAAEEVYALFENALAEYEVELCRFRERDQQEEPHEFLRIQSVRGDAPYPSSPGLVENQEVFWSADIKEEPEEHNISHEEEEQLHDAVPQSSGFFVKSEEFLQQRQVENDGQAHGEIIKETQVHSEDSSDTDNDDDWEPLVTMKPHSEGHDLSDVQSKDQRKAEQNSVLPRKARSATMKSGTELKGDKSGTGEEDEKKKHKCNICKKTFEKIKGLKIHINIHSEEQRKVALNGVVTAETASKTQKSGTVVKRDKSGTNEDAEKEKYQCKFCKKTFEKGRGLTAHIKIHTGERPYSCSFCEKTFTRKDSRDSHIRTHTGEKPYSCAFCTKSFADYSNLRKHERSHAGSQAGSQRYPCEHCKKTFARKDILSTHTYMKHGDKKAFVSSISNQTSADTSLNVTKRSQKGEKTLICAICKKSFPDRSSLNKHEATHAGQKTFTCSQCPKIFSCKGNLDAHTRTHTGEKPFTCSFCDRTFTHKTTLEVHKRLHTGEKPFKCLICKKSFAQRSNLLSHKRRHTGEQPFDCPLCDKTFAQLSNRDAHMRVHHADK